MALKARLKPEDHAKLTDALKPLYAESDGMFVLDVEEVEGWKLDNTDNLRATVQKERKRADEAETKLKAHEKSLEGLDVTKARDALKRLEAIDAGEPDDKTKRRIESIEKQLADKHAAEVGPLRETIAQRDREIDLLTVDRSLGEAIAKVKVIDGAAELLIERAKSKGHVKRIRTSDGQSVVRCFGDDGEELVTREAGKSGPMPVDEFVNVALRKKYPALFVVTDKSGSGDGGGSKPGTTKTTTTSDNLVGESRLAKAFAE